MSYQELYGSLNKKASNEQIKKLASVLKGRHMVKKASSEQVKQLAGMIKKSNAGALVLRGVGAGKGPARILNALFKNNPAGKTFGQKVFDQFAKHPKITTALKYAVPTAAAGTIGIGLGNVGKEGLRQDLASAKADVGRLTEEKKALENESWLSHLLRSFGEWWEKTFGKKPSAAPTAPAASK